MAHAVHERPHPRRHRHPALRRQRAGAGQPHPPGGPQHRTHRTRWRHRDRRRRRHADAGHVRGAHALLVERRGHAGRHPDHAAGRACAVVRQGRGLPRGRLHVLPGRGLRQAAAGRGDRNAINSGQIPGPRYLAASQEITVPGGLGDETLPHLPFPDFSFGVNVNGAEDMRKVVRMFLKYGVDSIKLNLSGDNFVPGANSHTTWMTDAEVAAAAEEVKMRGKRIIVHARSKASIQQALRHGIDLIYHASFTDTETLDLLEARKDRVFVAPGIAHPVRAAQRGEPLASRRATAISWGYQEEWDAASSRCRRCTSAASACCPAATTASPSTRTAERARPRVLRQVPGHDADGGHPLGHAVRRADHDARARTRRGEGRLPGRPAAGRRRPAGQPVDPARPQAHAGGDEGRRVRQGAARSPPARRWERAA
jgi:hypothetical protein